MKKLLALLLALSMVFTMAACGTSTPAETSESTEAQASQAATTAATEVELPKNVAIELWTDMTISADVLNNAIDAFEAEYADYGYTITLNQFAGSQRSALLSAAIETDTLPALFLSAWFTSADYVHQGLIADISDIAEIAKEELYPSVYEATQINGKSYMVGLYQSYYGFLYNADMLKAAGLEEYVSDDPYEISQWTVEDMETVILPTLAEYMKGTEKYPMPFFAADNQADTFMMSWLTMLGGEMWADGYSVAGEDANTVAALEKMISWAEAGYTNSNVITKSGAEVGGEFKNQVSAICSGQFVTYMNYVAAMEKGEMDQFDLRMGAIPVQKDGVDSVTLANYIYGACVMNNGDEDQMVVAKEFIKWLLQDEENLTAFNASALPCYKSILEKLSNETPIYASLAAIEPQLWDFTGGVAGYVSTRALLFPQLQAAFSGDKTAAEALADYQQGANEVIQEYMDNSLVLN